VTAALDLDWRIDARCRGADPKQFHPHLQGRGVGGGPDLRGPSRVAWEWCQPCPVIRDCHQLAERTDDTIGIYGGSLRYKLNGKGPVLIDPLVPAAPVREAS
jgi:transcription factor WhiB